MLIDPLVFRLHKTLRNAFQKDGHYLLAVSGGSDSMALAMACHCLSSEGCGSYSVCHVEHGLRGEEALRDMELVQNFCAEHNLPCHVRHVDVQSFAACKRLSVETAARELRHAALAAVAEEINADGIVFAHNQDDQAETVLLRLLRGTSLKGLGGIRFERRHNGVIALHPLLEFTHRQLAEYCLLQGVAFCHDSTNDDVRFTRNRVRHELLPYLERAFNGSVKESLARMACRLQAEEDFLERSALCCFSAALTEPVLKQPADMTNMTALMQFLSKKTFLCFSAKILRTAAAAIRRRVLRMAYCALTRRELDYERTLALEQLVIKGTGGKTVQLPDGVTAVCRKQQIIFEKS